ncbi:putative DNA excision repair protein rad2 [Rosellinia necatrix]|uniref:Putative DNA excision repair protein rad2 n=1 Tax=Rosellinia necatrix TaxID=77044 RepID=A0A1W2TKK9_ROSNE|nr:putative DNA excision repair protein rad2 [Rosellinia necatrix]
MGVNGLWTIVQPCARPTNLATLNRKRLAIDASIWIYQFLKAVRDKEGNALRNSHIVGFFRRICKLLWFGILPVFVFDGGAPALKRQTITNRKRRREGRRDDAVRTAGKLLAVQMQRIAEEEGEKRRRRREFEDTRRPRLREPEEEIPDPEHLVYVDELGMDEQERQRSRKFHKQDAYHLPDLNGGIEGMGRPEDPRIMSIAELEEYARQFQSGEDINLYDFSKIDFEGEFFKSLPPADRYNILNAARVRSRLRMGLSKDQLDGMFPDRMAFSRFQIERVRERNHLTQRLMQEAGMTGTDLTLGGNGRIAGERDREYILVKNEGAEGGWALGVVSREKDKGEIHKPIDVDALDIQYQTKEDDMDWEDDDFEDVPIEGLNRLPKIHDTARIRIGLDDAVAENNEEDTLFVSEDKEKRSFGGVFGAEVTSETLFHDEEDDLDRAIALSLKSQHGFGSSTQGRVEGEEEEEGSFEDVPAPEWTQKAVEQPKPVSSTSGSIIAHIVNNRANAAIPKRRESNASSDSEVDLRSAVFAARKKKPVASKPQLEPVSIAPNMGDNFGGPLPFEKLDWKSSIFGKKQDTTQPLGTTATDDKNGNEDLSGGFLQEMEDDEKPRPLPPWMMQDELDIRELMKSQQQREIETNQADLEDAIEEAKRRQRDAIIEIESSDSSDSDVEIIDAPLPHQENSIKVSEAGDLSQLSPSTLLRVHSSASLAAPTQTESTSQADAFQGKSNREASPKVMAQNPQSASESSSPEPSFEEVDIIQPPESTENLPTPRSAISPRSEDVLAAEFEYQAQGVSNEATIEDMSGLVIDQDESDDEYSDLEDEELLTQMAEEAEEHARFASQLNNKSERENQETYEQELKALRTQQKKDRRDADEVTQIMITECQTLLRYFGIPYIAAPMEAEAQCAELVHLGLVDGIVTDDSDIFLFGGTRVYKNMFNGNKFVECYLSSDLERELSLSREQLISIAQLLGSDYAEGLPGVGPVTAVEILSEFPGNDGLQKFHDWWQEVQGRGRPQEADKASAFRKKFRKAQATKLFLPPGFPSSAVADAYMHPEVDHSAEQFQWGSPDVEGLRQFLMATIGWSQDRTDEVLVPVIRDMNRREAEGTQSNITHYFEGGVGVGVKEAFAPRQKVQSSKRMTQAVNRLRAHATASSTGLGGPIEDENPTLRPGSRKRAAARIVTVADNDDEQGDDYEAGAQDSAKRKRKRATGGNGKKTQPPQ